MTLPRSLILLVGWLLALTGSAFSQSVNALAWNFGTTSNTLNASTIHPTVTTTPVTLKVQGSNLAFTARSNTGGNTGRFYDVGRWPTGTTPPAALTATRPSVLPITTAPTMYANYTMGPTSGTSSIANATVQFRYQRSATSAPKRVQAVVVWDDNGTIKRRFSAATTLSAAVSTTTWTTQNLPLNASGSDAFPTGTDIGSKAYMIEMHFYDCSASNNLIRVDDLVLLVDALGAGSPPPSIVTSGTLPNGEQNYAYVQQFTATGGSGAGYTWSLASGSLPPGLSLVGDKLIGIPTTLGTANFVIRVTDSLGGTITKAFTHTTSAAPTWPTSGSTLARWTFDADGTGAAPTCPAVISPTCVTEVTWGWDDNSVGGANHAEGMNNTSSWPIGPLPRLADGTTRMRSFSKWDTTDSYTTTRNSLLHMSPAGAVNRFAVYPAANTGSIPDVAKTTVGEPDVLQFSMTLDSYAQGSLSTFDFYALRWQRDLMNVDGTNGPRYARLYAYYTNDSGTVTRWTSSTLDISAIYKAALHQTAPGYEQFKPYKFDLSTLSTALNATTAKLLGRKVFFDLYLYHDTGADVSNTTNPPTILLDDITVTGNLTCTLYDFGDWNGSGAATTTTSSTVNNNLRLGATVDAEASVTPNSAADVDDTTGSDDEDGVLTPAYVSPGSVIYIPVTVTNNTGSSAFLAGWIDFDNNGAFNSTASSSGGTGEHSVTTISVPSSGTQHHLVKFFVPATTAAGTRGMRFRICSSDPGATGALGTGEVEDGVVTISAPAALPSKLYVSDYGINYVAPPDNNDSLRRFEASTGVTLNSWYGLTSANSGFTPWDIDSFNGTLFVGNRDSGGDMAKYDLNGNYLGLHLTNGQSFTRQAPNPPSTLSETSHFAFDAAGNVYVAHGYDSVVRFDPNGQNGTEVARTGWGLRGIAIDQSNGDIYMMHDTGSGLGGAGGIARVNSAGVLQDRNDLSTNFNGGTGSWGGSAFGIALKGGKVYLLHGNGTPAQTGVMEVNYNKVGGGSTYVMPWGANYRWFSQVGAMDDPRDLEVGPDDGHIYVAQHASGPSIIYKFDGTTGALINAVTAPSPTQFKGLAFGCPPVLDFGDHIYGTLAASSASQTASADIRIGTNATDAETTDPSTSAASLDDTTGADDEDVTMPTFTAGAATNLVIPVTIPVLANVSGSTSRINVFVDWNGDNDVADTGETQTVQTVAAAGTTNVTFSLTPPAGTTTGTKYLRIRATEGSTAPTFSGASTLKGEVEDYDVTVSTLAIGNLVWKDNNDNGRFDAGEGVSGVTLTLQSSATTTPTTGTAIATTTTDSAGLYQFTGLLPGSYYVWIPGTQFATGAPLIGAFSLVGHGVDNGRDDDWDENGIDDAAPATNGIRSAAFTLAAGGEPTTTETGADSGWDNGTPGRPADANADLTIDFGFATCSQTNLITNGSFETANPTNLTFPDTFPSGGTAIAKTRTATGNTDIANWTFDAGSYINDGTRATDGNRFVYLNASGCVGQQFIVGSSAPGFTQLAAGQTYTITFDWVPFNSSAPNSPPEGNNTTIYADFYYTDASWSASTFVTSLHDFYEPRTNDFQVTPRPLSTWSNLDWRRTRCKVTLPAPPPGQNYLTLFLTSDGNTPKVLIDNVRMTASCDPTVGMVGNLVWGDTNGDGIKGASEAGIDKAVVNLYRRPASGPPVLAGFTYTSQGGKYFFTGLNPATYYVEVSSDNFLATTPSWWLGGAIPGPLNGRRSSTGNANPNVAANLASDDDASEKGVDDSAPATNGILSPDFAITFGGEPVSSGGGKETGFDNTADDAVDASSDFTIDFGFVPSSSTADYGDYNLFGLASSAVTSSLRIGATTDSETIPTTNTLATGDDNTGSDDEDGVTLPASVAPGATSQTMTVNVTNTTGSTAFLNVWIDWDGDGVLGETIGGVAEQVATNTSIATGTSNSNQTVTFNVPAGIAVGPKGVRVRLTSVSSPSFDGLDGSGEVEDHLLTVASTSDFGDYSGFAAATQTADSAIRIGTAATDAEGASPANATATGDDTTGTDDEDVTMPSFTAGSATSLSVPVTINTAVLSGNTSRVRVFVDWNGDGDVADTSETLAAQTAATNGLNTLSFSLLPPAGTTAGTKYLRIRATEGSTAPTFSGTSTLRGEVEDYEINVYTTDFGDYASFAAASQTADSAILIGTAATDGDPAGLANTTATGDDTTDTDDEDLGMPTFTVGSATNLAIPVSLNVAGLSGSTARINVFVDWNGDGDVLDPGETQTAQALNATGFATFAITTPSGTSTGTKYLRVRITEGSTAPTFSGASTLKGEVEDYAITVRSPLAPGACNADVVFLLDQSGSIDGTEWSQMITSVNGIIDRVLAPGSGNQVAVVDYAGTNLPLLTPQVWLETDFTTDAATAKSYAWRATPIAAPGTLHGGDDAHGAVGLIGNAIDGVGASEVLSPLKTLNRNSTRPLIVFLFSDAVRSAASSYLVNYASPGVGTAAAFENYTAFKNSRLAKFVCVLIPVDGTGEPAAAAIASFGGSHTGAVEANPADPDGSATTPRRLFVGPTFVLTAAQMDAVASDICSAAALVDYGDYNGFAAATQTASADIRIGTAATDVDANNPANATATGDDTSGTDDEDLTMPSFTVGTATNLVIPVTIGGTVTAARINVFVDWNGDGDVADTAETQTVQSVTSSGNLSFSLTPPAGATAGTKYLRIRLVDGTTAPNFSGASTVRGEVEDYAVNVWAFEYGDATGYASASAAQVADTPKFGALVDFEASQPADDNTVGADEDGVNVATTAIQGKYLYVNYDANTTAAAYVNLWLDWNRDGDFADAGEQVLTNELHSSRTTGTLRIPVPASAVPGASWLRARIASASGAAATGSTADGEVEDHPVTIVDGTTISGVAFEDANNNGQRDAGERLLPGVLVLLRETLYVEHMLTDATGAWQAIVAPGTWRVVYTLPSSLGFTFNMANANLGNDATDSDVSSVAALHQGTTGNYVITAGSPDVTNVDCGFVPVPNSFTYTTLTTAGTGNWASSVTLPKYFSSTAMLSNVGASFNLLPATDVYFENTDPAAGTLQFTGTGTGATVTFPHGPASAAVNRNFLPNPPGTRAISAAGGARLFGPGSGFTFGALAGTTGNGDHGAVFAFSNTTLGAGNAAYLGTAAGQTFSVPVSVTTNYSIGGVPSSQQKFVTSTPVGVAVAYVWTDTDFGDLQDTGASTAAGDYQTLRFRSGPRHTIVSGLGLGALVDPEPDAAPSAGADGDDLAGAPDDEDSIASFPVFVAGQTSNVVIATRNTTASAANLSLWVDFNNSGNFAEAGEQVAVDTLVAVNATSVTIPVAVPAGAVVNTPVGFRVRLSHDAGLTSLGAATDGEVEDYLVTVAAPLAIGNLVWNDANNNGVKDAIELGVSGALVQLFNPGADNAIGGAGANADTQVGANFTTGATGAYSFTNLLAGNYYVKVTPPSAGMLTSGTPATADNNVDGNNDGSQPGGLGTALFSPVINLAAGAESTTDGDGNNNTNLTVDFGLFSGMTVGNLVFNDVNNNGTYESATESGISGLAVELCDAAGASFSPAITTTTNASGAYSFTVFVAGTYRVKVTPNGAYPVASSTAGTDNGTDSNNDGTQLGLAGSVSRSFAFTLAPAGEPGTAGTGNTENTIDFGFRACPTIVVDPEFPATPQVGTAYAQTFIASGGAAPYTFSVSAGSLPAWASLNPSTGALTGLPNSTTSATFTIRATDVNGCAGTRSYTFTPTCPAITVTPGTLADAYMGTAYTQAVAFSATGLTGTYSWSASGVPGGMSFNAATRTLTGTPAIAGAYTVVITATDTTYPSCAGTATITFRVCPSITVSPASLSDANVGVPFSVTLSASGGDAPHVFSVIAGSLPSWATLSPAGVLSGTPDNITPATFTVAATDVAGCIGTRACTLTTRGLSIGNLVWDDFDNDGVRDAGEAGLPTVRVQLLRPGTDGLVNTGDDTQVGTDIFTDASGAYLFQDLMPGDYYVRVTPASGFPKTGGTPDTADNGQDNDNNGAQPGGLGAVLFSPKLTLAPGTEPAGDGDGTNGDLTVDFGLHTGVQLGNLVWHDANNNGLFDGGESGLPGLSVHLLDAGSGTQLASTTTNAGGGYGFTLFANGSYRVRVMPPPSHAVASPVVDSSDNAEDNDNNGSQPGLPGTAVLSNVFTITAGNEPGGTGVSNTESTIDIGLSQTVSVGNLVFKDLNNDGFYTSAVDQVVSGVTVQLFPQGSDPLVASPASATTTDAAGHYLLSAAPGSYFVYVPASQFASGAPLENTRPSLEPALGGIPAVDDDGDQNALTTAKPSAEGVRTPDFTLNFGGGLTAATGETGDDSASDDAFDTSADLTVDLGFYPMGAPGFPLAGRVTRTLGGGSAAPSEPLEGVTIAVYEDADGDGELAGGEMNALDSATTNGDGQYEFLLPPGDYVVMQEVLPGATAVADSDGGDPSCTNVAMTGSACDGVDFVQALEAQTFAQWRDQNALGGENGADQNPDGDLYANLLEYALGTPAGSGRAASRFRLERTAPGAVDAVLVRPVNGHEDVRYTLEGITDLAQSPAGWAAVEITPVVTSNNNGTETLRFANLEGAIGTTGFVRVKVTLDADQNGAPEAAATTPAHGWSRREFASGTRQTLSMPLVRSEIFAGLVLGAAGDALTISDVGFADLIGNGASCYVEVLSGAKAGHRLEVNEAACTATTIALASGGGEALAGARITVRAHWTLRELLPPASFSAATSAAQADRVLFFDSAANAYQVFWLLAGSTPRWVRDGDATLADAGSRLVRPAEGMIVHARHSTAGLLLAGQVRSGSFALPLAAGSHLVGTGAAVALSPSGSAMTPASGFVAGTTPETSSRLRFWLGDETPGATGYGTWSLHATGSAAQWRAEGGAADLSEEQALDPFRAVFLMAPEPLPGWVLPPQ